MVLQVLEVESLRALYVPAGLPVAVPIVVRQLGNNNLGEVAGSHLGVVLTVLTGCWRGTDGRWRVHVQPVARLRGDAGTGSCTGVLCRRTSSRG